MIVDFFFGPGSRYSYLAATQLERLAAETAARFRWRPVLSADLVARTGGPRTPQESDWRLEDILRWARLYGVPFVDPPEGTNWRRLVLACVAAERLGAAEPFAHAVYDILYARGHAIGDAHLPGIGKAAGLDPVRFAKELESPEIETACERNLNDALAAGAFGVPSFVTPDDALFFGQDRLPLLRAHLLR